MFSVSITHTAQPKITYPSPLLELCKPFDLNICEASGNPPPHVQLFLPVARSNNVYKCYAENIHIDNSGMKTRHYEIFEFYCKFLCQHTPIISHNKLVFLNIYSVGNTTGACGPKKSLQCMSYTV